MFIDLKTVSLEVRLVQMVLKFSIEYLNFFGPKKLENLLFSEMIVIGQSSYKCLGLSSHTITILKIRSVTHLITKVSNIMHTQINGWPSKVTLRKNKLMGDRNN